MKVVELIFTIINLLSNQQEFSTSLKTAKLVLIPIFGKVYERMIKKRPTLGTVVLSIGKFGFGKRKSTIMTFKWIMEFVKSSKY